MRSPDYYAIRRWGWNDSFQLESALRVQLAIFGGCALAASDLDEHLQVQPFAECVVWCFGNDHFDQGNSRGACRNFPDVSKDRHGLGLGPVVNDHPKRV